MTQLDSRVDALEKSQGTGHTELCQGLTKLEESVAKLTKMVTLWLQSNGHDVSSLVTKPGSKIESPIEKSHTTKPSLYPATTTGPQLTTMRIQVPNFYGIDLSDYLAQEEHPFAIQQIREELKGTTAFVSKEGSTFHVSQQQTPTLNFKVDLMDKINSDLSTPLVEQPIVLHQVSTMDEFANEYQAHVYVNHSPPRFLPIFFAKQHLFNLDHAQHRRDKMAQAKRCDLVFAKGNNVLLKLQPHCHSTVQRRINAMLAPWYYGPFRILQKLSALANKRMLPPTFRAHHVFHGSQLGHVKQHHALHSSLEDKAVSLAVGNDTNQARKESYQIILVAEFKEAQNKGLTDFMESIIRD
ncbi:PREDICTED: uncharacterized protein LOC109173437 [Ipomoea nil]|uniref:uncharacterized protein LOC109173437 n=1 Tax=Ipomoea nil TaxID=35883 RepID=UPI000901F903|nr:PREDICTED: uncharacterized protein LOC109173437 [Ipomoea nil]